MFSPICFFSFFFLIGLKSIFSCDNKKQTHFLNLKNEYFNQMKASVKMMAYSSSSLTVFVRLFKQDPEKRHELRLPPHTRLLSVCLLLGPGVV